ncbi:MAG: cysteine hydrolase [Coriobacteriales bacterium]|jgi:nicotinamidase-related amidase|nr:cysteine hydrolase [Coriobacteriales bacterium]
MQNEEENAIGLSDGVSDSVYASANGDGGGCAGSGASGGASGCTSGGAKGDSSDSAIACKTAIIVVDMLNDFVTGSLACERGAAIVPALARLLDGARRAGCDANGIANVPIVYANDCHLPGIDHELKLWGEHAMKGTYGAEVVLELAPKATDYIVPKRRYSGFFMTDMNILLRELGVNTVVMTGLHTHMCVRHTTADAYMHGYDVVVASDATDAFTEQDYLSGLEYLRTVYGAMIATVDEIVDAFSR